MMERLIEIDRALTLAINSLNCPVSDAFWQFMSDVRIWIPFYAVLVGWLFVRLGTRRALVVIASVVLTVVLCDQTANLVKDTVCRLRPCHDGEMIARGLNILERKGGQYGFFSGHAANAFGVAICASLGVRIDLKHNYRGFTAFMMAWAALVAISRVFVGKHFLGDILAGSAVGLILGYLAARLARQLLYRLEKV